MACAEFIAGCHSKVEGEGLASLADVEGCFIHNGMLPARLCLWDLDLMAQSNVIIIYNLLDGSI